MLDSLISLSEAEIGDLSAAISMRFGHRKAFPVAIKKLQAAQKRKEEEQEDLAQFAATKSRIEMERELQHARNIRDVEDQEQNLKGKSGFGWQTENNTKDSNQARVETSQSLPPSMEWGMCEYVIHMCVIYEFSASSLLS